MQWIKLNKIQDKSYKIDLWLKKKETKKIKKIEIVSWVWKTLINI